MRLSELLGTPVADGDGAEVGAVADVVLVQDGPLLAARTSALRVTGLIVVQHRHARLLGYERDLRPVVLRAIVRRMAGDTFNVGWEQIDSVSPQVVRLRVRRADLELHRRAMRT